MADIKKIQLPGVAEAYDIVDAGARELISELQQYTDYLGVTTTALTDGATTNPITIEGESVTAEKGNIANYGSKEFIFNGTAWQEFGDLSGLGELAYEDSAEGSYTPAGTVAITKGADTTDSVTPFGSAGTLPSFSVSGETLTFSAGALASAGTAVTVVTARGTDTAAFSGTAATITVSAAE